MVKPLLKPIGLALATGALGGVAQSLAHKTTNAAIGQGVISDALVAIGSRASEASSSSAVGKIDDVLTHGFNFSKSQIEKIANAMKNKQDFALRFN